MMRTKSRGPAFSPVKERPSVAASVKGGGQDSGGSPPSEEVEWEVRPGGMLVQRRNPEADAAPAPPVIRVRVKYGSAYHEIYLSAQATFGELKKLVAERTGLHPQGQKLLYKDKERESNAYLDVAGVKDRSKIVLVEDPAGQARRSLEMRKSAKMEKAAKSISQISLEVDKLATKVVALEAIVSKGKKVAEDDVVRLIEQLMNQLLKLEGITADVDLKHQRSNQVRRVQKYVETLDALKIKNSMPRPGVEMAPGQQKQQQEKLPQQKLYNSLHPPRQQPQRMSQTSVVVTTNWESFDLLSGPSPMAASTAAAVPNGARTAASVNTTTTAAATINPPTTVNPTQRFDWELF